MFVQPAPVSCPSASPCEAPKTCFFYRDGTTDGEGCWGELDKDAMTCPRGWTKVGETSTGCFLNHLRPKCTKTSFSGDPVECCFTSDGTNPECPPQHCQAKQNQMPCVKVIEDYCTDYDPSKPDGFGDKMYDRMSRARCQAWARDSRPSAYVDTGNDDNDDITGSANADDRPSGDRPVRLFAETYATPASVDVDVAEPTSSFIPVRDRPRVKDAVFKYCASRPGLRDPFCRCVNADKPEMCAYSRRCADPGRDCCYAWRFRNDPAMLEQTICFADECKGTRAAGAYTWTPTGCSDVCAPILQFKGQLTTDKRITALVDCSENRLSPEKQREFFGSEEAYEQAQEEARRKRELGELALAEGVTAADNNNDDDDDDDDDAGARSLRATLSDELTSIVANTTNQFFAAVDQACVQRLNQTVSLALGKHAEVRSCGAIEAVAKANLAFTCIQTATNTTQVVEDLAAEISAALADPKQAPTLAYVVAGAAANDVSLPTQSDVTTLLTNTIRNNTTSECRQDKIQSLNIEVGDDASVVSGCNAEQVKEYGDLCSREQKRVADAVARGDSVDDILANVDREAQAGCAKLDNCCNPKTQGIAFHSGLDLDQECTQVSTLVNAILDAYENGVAVVFPQYTHGNDDSGHDPNEGGDGSGGGLQPWHWALIIIGAIVLVVFAVVVGFAVAARRKNPEMFQRLTSRFHR